KNPLIREIETLNKKQEIEEEIFLGLRLIKGIDFNYINQKYNIDIYQKYKKQFDKFIKEGFIEKTQNGAKLTLDGILLSNEILCEFIEL
ncbi:coproporphyrinogen III oxidase, partial [bacterium]|nr:coproporphyrinogen III oxidase [bacterium]